MSVKLLKEILPVEGVRLGVAASGERYENRNDLLVMELSEGTTCAALFTKNVFCAAAQNTFLVNRAAQVVPSDNSITSRSFLFS